MLFNAARTAYYQKAVLAAMRGKPMREVDLQQQYICLETKIFTPQQIKYRPGRSEQLDPPNIRVIDGFTLASYYDVKPENCIFLPRLSDFNDYCPNNISDYIILTYREENDYKEHLAILRAEHLLNS